MDADRTGRPGISEAVSWLRARPWQGNLRELRNVIARAELLGGIPGMDTTERVAVPVGRDSEEEGYPLDWTLEQVKEAHMRRVVEAHEGNKSAAARQLGVSRKTLERKFGTADPNERQ